MKTKIILILSLTMLSGCSKPFWRLEYHPTTDTERAAVAAHVEKVLGVTPKSLSGHDQDWDDAIKAAEEEARVDFCRPTLWEHDGYSYTGRWKYVEEANP